MPRQIPLHRLAGELRDGERVYLAGASGEATGFVDVLTSQRQFDKSIELITTFVPGINVVPIDELPERIRVTGLFMHANLAAAQRSGRFRHLPLSYSGFTHFAQQRLKIDVSVFQVSPPDARGLCSLGPAVEFAPVVHARSARRMAICNPNVPRIPDAVTLPYADFDAVCESDAPLRSYSAGASNPTLTAIAACIAGFVEDGATLQVGLGKVPNALFDLLHDRRGLRIHSGMLSDPVMQLAASGALDPDAAMTTCVVVGSDALYRWSAQCDRLSVRGCDETHAARVLHGIERFVSVNSALEVDLFGQCNLELADGHAISGVGGAADFALAGHLSRGGLSIVALPASSGKLAVSRIVARLGEKAVTSLPRDIVDVVVTEHGAADLRGKSVHERAEALIGISDPKFRNGLIQDWRAITSVL